MREEITHAQNPLRMENWEGLQIPERTREVRKICRKHKGPIRKKQSESIWRGPGSSASRMLGALWGSRSGKGIPEVPAQVSLPSEGAQGGSVSSNPCLLRQQPASGNASGFELSMTVVSRGWQEPIELTRLSGCSLLLLWLLYPMGASWDCDPRLCCAIPGLPSHTSLVPQGSLSLGCNCPEVQRQ